MHGIYEYVRVVLHFYTTTIAVTTTLTTHKPIKSEKREREEEEEEEYKYYRTYMQLVCQEKKKRCKS